MRSCLCVSSLVCRPGPASQLWPPTTYKTLSFSDWKFPVPPSPRLNFHQSRERSVDTERHWNNEWSSEADNESVRIRNETERGRQLEIFVITRPAGRLQTVSKYGRVTRFTLLGFWRISLEDWQGHISDPGPALCLTRGKLEFILFRNVGLPVIHFKYK